MATPTPAPTVSSSGLATLAQSRRVFTALLPVGVLFCITVGLLWKIALTSEFTWLNGPDFANQVAPWFEFQAREWQSGHFPLWDPYHWGGQPFVGQAQPGAMYPLNWLFFLLPTGDDGHVSIVVLHWYQVAMHFLAAVFAYLLCRDLTRSKIASVLGGVAYAFSGFVGTADWPQMVNGAVWVPLVLLFFFRCTRQQTPLLSAAVSGACLGVSFLSGHHQVPTFTAALLAALWIHAFIASRLERKRLVRPLALFLLFTFLCSAAQVLPAYEYGHIAFRWVGSKNPVTWQDKVPYSVHDQFSLNPVGFLGTIIPGLHMNFDPFIGITVLLLAVGGTLSMWAHPSVRVLVVTGIAALVFSFGSASAFHGLFYALVPGIEKARSPSAAVFAFQLAAAVLAAYGCDILMKGEQCTRSKWRTLAWVAGGSGVALYFTLLVAQMFQGDKVYLQSRTATIAFAALILAAVLAAAERGVLTRSAIGACTIALVVFELSTIVGFAYPSREQGWNLVDNWQANGDVVRFLRAQKGPFRIGVDSADIPYNFGDWTGLEQFGGYTGVTQNIVHTNGLIPIHMLLGEQFWIGRKAQQPAQELVFTGSSGVNVYRNREALSVRAWTVHKASTAANEAELLSKLARPVAELRDTALLSTADVPALDSCPGSDDVTIQSRGKTIITMDVSMACTGFLILADTFTPGWRATVDNKTSAIYEVYGTVRGIVVPAGHHRVQFRYRPWSVYLGTAFSCLGFVLLAAFAIATHGRRKGTAQPTD